MLPESLTEEHRERVCKIGQGAECCRFLVAGAGGFSCEKHTALGFTLSSKEMTARGDNCEGVFLPRLAFRLLRDRFEHPAGTTIYRAALHDYGCASDDARFTGHLHSSMTLSPAGGYPFFTVPDDDFEAVEAAA